jgi:protein involved in polysaccharide export with SLBB domain
MNRMMSLIATFGWIGALAGVVLTCAVLYRQQGALARLEDRMAQAAVQSASVESTSSQADPGVVFVDGAVARPGVYSLPAMGTLTASRVISAAGGVKGSVAIQILPELDADARLTEWRSWGGPVGVRDGAACFVLQREDVAGVTPRDVALRAGDTVWVTRP